MCTEKRAPTRRTHAILSSSMMSWQLWVAIVALLCAASASAGHHSHNNTASAAAYYRAQYYAEHNATTDRRRATSATVTTGNWSEVHDQSTYSATLDTYLSSSSVLYGLIGQSTPVEIGERCHKELLGLYSAIHRRDVWAMKMLDASATAQSGFVWGNNLWLGSRQQCESVQGHKHITLSPRFERNMKPHLIDARAPFDVGYRVVYARHESPWQVEVEFLISDKVLHLGVCVPLSCSHRDIHQLTQAYLDSSQMEALNLFVYRANVIQVKALQLTDAFYDKLSLRIVGAFLLFTVLMVSLATVYESNRAPTKPGRSVTTPPPIAADANFNYIKSNSTDRSAELQPESPANVDVEPQAVERFVACFSLRSNVRAVLSTATPPTAVPAVNAFKSVGCLMILNFHLAWYSLFTMDNGAELFAMGEQLQWQWLSTTPIIVDIFFAISGLLLAYNFLRNEKRVAEIRGNTLAANAHLFGRQFVHRYLRLTPLYLCVCGLTDIAYAHIADTSPFWIKDRVDRVCERNWWHNVLYVQNFFAVSDMCLNWTWSLACEMQFFVLCSALLFVYVRRPRLAVRLFGGAFAVFALVLVAISWRLQFTPAYDVLHDLGTEMYTAPWVRVQPYLVGVASGWYLHRSAGRPLPLSRKWISALWTLASTVMCVCHLATWERSIGPVFGVPMIVALRLFYGSAACWMIVASAKGEGGRFARVCAWPVFVHVNKLSYGIYLLNPIVVTLVYAWGDDGASVEPVAMMTASVGIMVIVYAMSFVFSLLFEMPYTRLSAEILRVERKPKVL